MTTNAPLDRQKLDHLITDIELCTRELENIGKLRATDLERDRRNYAVAEHYLRRALEGILTAGTHIISRLPTNVRDYRDIIVALGQNKIIPGDFAERNRGLAGYRNRLVHLYWEIAPPEMLRIIQEHLGDLKTFCRYFKQVLGKPQDFGLELE